MSIRLLSLATLIALVIGGQASAGISFLDEDFTNFGVDWSSVEIVDTSTQSSAGLSLSGDGNPGTSLRVVYNIGGQPFAELKTFHGNANFVYDPSVNGAIQTIDFSSDARTIPPGGAFNYFFGFEQAGNIFEVQLANVDFGPFDPRGTSGLTASSFVASQGSTGVPDFSVAGDPITFGFLLATSIGNSTQFSQFGAELDNYLVQISADTSTIPEPGSFSLLLVGSGLLGAARILRRKAKS